MSLQPLGTKSSPSHPYRHNEDSSPQPEDQSSPPYSPITPELVPSQLASVQTPGSNISPGASISANSTKYKASPKKLYTHKQEPQTFISHPLPSLETVNLDDNPDAIALRSAISILQIQRQTALADMKTLQTVKKRALEGPTAFVGALMQGEIQTRSPALIDLPPVDDDDVDEEMEDTVGELDGIPSEVDVRDVNNRKRRWPELPTPQNVVKTPYINWSQYGIVGESLDKLHADQLKNPPAGTPAKIGSDGKVVFAESKHSRARQSVSGASGLPGVKMEKMGTRKGGKR